MRRAPAAASKFIAALLGMVSAMGGCDSGWNTKRVASDRVVVEFPGTVTEAAVAVELASGDTHFPGFVSTGGSRLAWFLARDKAMFFAGCAPTGESESRPERDWLGEVADGYVKREEKEFGLRPKAQTALPEGSGREIEFVVEGSSEVVVRSRVRLLDGFACLQTVSGSARVVSQPATDRFLDSFRIAAKPVAL
jgi:hypothetical protein